MVPTGAGLSYSIDGNTQASPLFSGLVPNSYNVTVRNAGGCTSTASLAVILPGPTVPSTPVVNVVNNCNGTWYFRPPLPAASSGAPALPARRLS